MRNQERVMIGINGTPSLLVEITAAESPNSFMFEVINGRWKGVYSDGFVTILGERFKDDEPIKCEILTRNPDRLRGDYADVFRNFHDVNYVAPKPRWVETDDYDDDIPF